MDINTEIEMHDLVNQVKQLMTERDELKTENEILTELSDEPTLTVPDIRNKLTPITHLIAMVERGENELIQKSLSQAKESVNYLAQRNVYQITSK